MQRTSPLGVVLALSFVGCAPGAQEGAFVDLGTGVRLDIEHFAEADVEGFHIEIDRIACQAGEDFEAFHLEANVDLIDGVLPGGVTFLGQDQLGEDSHHIGSDLFVELEPGCYEVLAAPAAAVDGDAWTPSDECGAATGEAEVEAGLTAELLLISQCQGDPDGALDTVVVLNQEPELEVDLEEKIGLECVERDICVRVQDPDDDPVDIALDIVGGGDFLVFDRGETRVVGFEDGARIWETCWAVVPNNPGTIELEAVVRDLAFRDGQLVPVEDITGEPSRDSLRFPFHTVWEEALCIDDNGAAVPVSGEPADRVANCDWTDPQEYYCDLATLPDLVPFVCDAQGDVILANLYPACDDGGTGDDDDDDDDDDDTGDDDDDDDDDDDTGDDDDDDDDTGDDDDDDDDTGTGDDDDDDDDDDDGCLTQGYWKNHPEAWPVSSLTLGGVSYAQAELLALLGTPTRGDASLILAHQLIAAKLNIEAFGSDAAAEADIASADALLAANPDQDGRLPFAIPSSTEVGQAAVAIAEELDRFNNSDDCDDEPVL